ncbi:F-box domain [Arabidopsis suecica]|uniref:F-box domain n=1 Tax=Arabidopsis suecica TaxID=45249 RepID=A0A8T2AIE4_ARASU|nr:F-box domain [Arabidopsis suecica]
MTTMISNLPKDLIEEILSRISWKSMKAVRLTCKSWNNLSKSEMYIGKSTREGQSMMIAMMPHNLYLMSCVVDVDPSIEHKGQLSFLHNQVSISRVFHYEGLILCILKDVTRIVVLNPYLGQTRWIKLRFSHCQQRFDMFSYALGYEHKESCRSFKFLRFIDYFYKAPETKFFWYEIYDFDSGSWSTLDVTPHWFISCGSKGLSLKGNTYWCARERTPENGLRDHIICFDFTRERFGPLLPLPVNFTDHDYGSVTLSCVKEEKIAALFQHYASYDSEFEIWITTKIEAEMVTWSKFLRMDTEPKIVFPDTFFIDEEKKIFMDVGRDYDSDSDDYPEKCINIIGEAGYLKKLDLGVPAYQNHWPDVCSYVPSLVHIKKLARGKRIEQSSLEKHRFDQNMLRLAAIEKLMKKQNRYW